MPRQSLKDLKAKWYKKLRDKGFKDIEDDKGRLVTWSTSQALKAKTAKYQKADYYRLANQFIYDKKFDTVKQRAMWTFHAYGLSFDAIAKIQKLPRATVQHRIERLRSKFFK